MQLPFNVDLNGKTVVITGGAGVLGHSFGMALSACGAKVAILDLNEEAAVKAASEIKAETGFDTLAVPCNVLDKASMEEAAAKVEAAFGPCDLLLNGAGGNHPKGTTSKEYFEAGDIEDPEVLSFFDLDPDSISKVFNLNFLGTLMPTQAFAKQMIGRKGCSIINVSSMNAYRPLTKIPAYSGAKAAISNFTQWLAVHFAKSGIRVNALAPGFFVTNQNRGMLIGSDGEYTSRAKKIVEHTPMGRFGEADELIGTLLFLASESAASFVNGVVIPVDGGFAAYSGV